MQIPLINAGANGRANTAVFSGLNRTDRGQNGEFADMVNMASDHYPCLSPRRPRFKSVDMDNIRAVIAPKYDENADKVMSFTGVAGTAFYYGGRAIEFEDDDMAIPETGNITLADFNGKIIICAYEAASDTGVMYYYDYTATGNDTVRRMEKTVRNVRCNVYSSGNPDEDASVTNYISASVNWSEYFNVGDAIFLENFTSATNTDNNTVNMDSRYEMTDAKRAISCVVEKIEGNKLYFQMFNYAAQRLILTNASGGNLNGTVETLTISVKLPRMNHICIHNNRLWGTNPNGEYFYASKLGDPFNFNSFQGLANDSYYSEIGTKGGFMGIVSYRDNLVAFKRDYIHHIYGDKPSNFTIPKQLADCGCIDIRSVMEIGAVLYFLGYNGFYQYTGGQPSLISSPLNCSYKSAVGMSDGIKYFVSAIKRHPNEDGEYETELLVYDTRYGLWHKEDDFEAVGYFRWHNDLYIASDSEIFICGQGTDTVEWSAQSVISHENSLDNKGVNEIWIRAKLDSDASIAVYTRVNGGEWIRHETLTEKGLKVYRVPVRFLNGEYYEYRLEGRGGAVIYDIERVVYIGGRPYKKGW